MVLPYIEMNPPQEYTCSPSWTLLPPRSPYHPSGSSQCTSPKHPVLCIEPGLATHFTYDIIHISMPFSQIISPSPSLTESFILQCLYFQCINTSNRLTLITTSKAQWWAEWKLLPLYFFFFWLSTGILLLHFFLKESGKISSQCVSCVFQISVFSCFDLINSWYYRQLRHTLQVLNV